MGKISREMVSRAFATFRGFDGDSLARMRAALEAVEAELCAEPAPFVLSEEETACLEDWEPLHPSQVQRVVSTLRGAIERARTLGPQPAQGGEHGMCVEVGAAKALEERAEAAESRVKELEMLREKEAQKEEDLWEVALEAAGAITTTGTLKQCIAHVGRELKRESDMRNSHELNVAKYRKEIERLRELESAKPVAQELSKDDASFLGDCEADLAFGDSLTRDEYARLVAIIRNHFPKPAPVSPADPVRDLVEKFRGAAKEHADQGSGEVAQTIRGCAAALERALAARDAQKTRET